MTCIIAVKTIGGHALFASDTCVSWKYEGTGRVVYRDELQKIYGLSPNVAIALTTANLKVARDLLEISRSNVDIIAEKLRTKKRVWLSAHSIRRFLFYLWNLRNGPNTGLLIGMSHGGAGRIFWWESRMLVSPTQELQNGEFKILGSIRKDSPFYAELEKELRDVALYRVGNFPITAEQAAVILYDKLTQVFRSNAARESRVGGLFQVAMHAEPGFVMTDYEGIALSSATNGPSYSVGIKYDHENKRWVQINHITGVEVPLLAIDEHSFKPTGDNTFSY